MKSNTILKNAKLLAWLCFLAIVVSWFLFYFWYSQLQKKSSLSLLFKKLYWFTHLAFLLFI
ncbi:hypothetical protein P700755_000261 [Psychroflexus torquis ATCC 700755]|uniref:Uncharacterized protein n=1 Tax=Psychroflexus torquis (strain ATCC 700755 / CIP 106069 / ACAM 623) TaxID=313595 RepID=K4IA49_PSYTT|nr:hypothetical protein P700755_000261 [Psychroflexus torquis ATCC 700755]